MQWGKYIVDLVNVETKEAAGNFFTTNNEKEANLVKHGATLALEALGSKTFESRIRTVELQGFNPLGVR